MRFLIISLLCFIFLINKVNAQTNPVINNKYAIQLPDAWKGKTKLLIKITAFIQSKIPELKDKQECLNCNADYLVKFYVSEPTIKNISHKTGSSEFVTLYHFTSFMDVYNKDKILIKRIVFTDNDDAMYYTTTVAGIVPIAQNSINQIKTANAISARMNQPNYNPTNSTYDLARIDALRQAYTTNFDGNKYIKENRGKFIPSSRILWNEVENILLNIKLVIK
jgi:hypothetical protein